MGKQFWQVFFNLFHRLHFTVNKKETHVSCVNFLISVNINKRVDIGLTAKRHSNGVSLAGRWRPDAY